MKTTKKKNTKLSLLALLLALFCLFAFYKDIQNLFYFAILVVLIMHGVNAIIDFILRLPMQVGYSRVLYKNKENATGRIIGLIMACAMVSFGVWWILSKPI